MFHGDLQGSKQMRETFKILRKLGNGEQLLVAISEELGKAKQLRESLNRHWPGSYSIEETAPTIDVEKGETHN
jgi:hypothetical protein